MLTLLIIIRFGCDVGQFSNSALGIMDTNLFDYKQTFGTGLGMTKAQRLQTGESSMTHAMGMSSCSHLCAGVPVTDIACPQSLSLLILMRTAGQCASELKTVGQTQPEPKVTPSGCSASRSKRSDLLRIARLLRMYHRVVQGIRIPDRSA